MSFSDSTPEAPRRLRDVTSAAGFADRAMNAIKLVAGAVDDAAVIEVLNLAKAALGAEHAAFVSYVRDDDSRESFRFLLACDPVWCIEYQQNGWYANDAWLLYATTNSEPICGSKIPLRTKSQLKARELAARHGIVSSYIVPAPASGGLSRLGVLGLGSSQQGYFECEEVAILKLLARALAMELHEWWARRVRQEIIAKNRIKPEDLQLLALERQGLGTKEIAEELGVTASSVDSRFQRLSTKFNMPNRRATARLAAEYGLLCDV